MASEININTTPADDGNPFSKQSGLGNGFESIDELKQRLLDEALKLVAENQALVNQADDLQKKVEQQQNQVDNLLTRDSSTGELTSPIPDLSPAEIAGLKNPSTKSSSTNDLVLAQRIENLNRTVGSKEFRNQSTQLDPFFENLRTKASKQKTPEDLERLVQAEIDKQIANINDVETSLFNSIDLMSAQIETKLAKIEANTKEGMDPAENPKFIEFTQYQESLNVLRENVSSYISESVDKIKDSAKDYANAGFSEGKTDRAIADGIKEQKRVEKIVAAFNKDFDKYITQQKEAIAKEYAFNTAQAYLDNTKDAKMDMAKRIYSNAYNDFVDNAPTNKHNLSDEEIANLYAATGGNINPADVNTVPVAPPVQKTESTIRYYHGTTAEDSSEFSGKTFLSPYENYARNYGNRNNNVLYTDFTKQEAIDRGLYDETNNYPINGSINDGKDRLKKLEKGSSLPPGAPPGPGNSNNYQGPPNNNPGSLTPPGKPVGGKGAIGKIGVHMVMSEVLEGIVKPLKDLKDFASQSAVSYFQNLTTATTQERIRPQQLVNQIGKNAQKGIEATGRAGGAVGGAAIGAVLGGPVGVLPGMYAGGRLGEAAGNLLPIEETAQMLGYLYEIAQNTSKQAEPFSMDLIQANVDKQLAFLQTNIEVGREMGSELAELNEATANLQLTFYKEALEILRPTIPFMVKVLDYMSAMVGHLSSIYAFCVGFAIAWAPQLAVAMANALNANQPAKRNKPPLRDQMQDLDANVPFF